MSKRYSKKVREEAALICAIAASGGVKLDSPLAPRVYTYGDIRMALAMPFGSLAIDLALDAWRHARGVRNWTRETDAEAEALIRTGWSPS